MRLGWEEVLGNRCNREGIERPPLSDARALLQAVRKCVSSSYVDTISKYLISLDGGSPEGLAYLHALAAPEGGARGRVL